MAHRSKRKDGWTPERQVAFLTELAAARSITAAARAAGMSRESAYRLRARADGSLFAHLWDLALAPAIAPEQRRPDEGHVDALTNGQLLRLLGIHYRRERGDFAHVGIPRGQSRTW